MAAHKQRPAPPRRLERGRQRFEEWRRSRTKRRIPEDLWESAVDLAEEFGIHSTCRVLRLSYDSLKKRVVARGAVQQREVPPQELAPFVELFPRQPAESVQGTAQFEAADGSRVQISWSGSAPDLASVSRSFFFGDSV